MKSQTSRKVSAGKTVSLADVLPPGALPTSSERAKAKKVLKDVAAGKIKVRYV